MSRRNAVSIHRSITAVIVLGLILAAGVVGARWFETKTAVPLEDAGKQLTSHTSAMNTAQIFVDGKWYAQRNVETLLLMGIDDYNGLVVSDSYNNNHQTDYLVLFIRDRDTGRATAIHLNRDVMTQIPTLGVTGEATGMRYAQLALAYNYGAGDHISSQNVVNAVEYLFYGMQVDHYITITMDAVPIINDWAGGVTVEVLDDFSGIDETLVKGELVKLVGDQALTYVRARQGLDNSSNLKRMERQRQYTGEWIKSAKDKLDNTTSVAELVLKLENCYRSNCTTDELQSFAEALSANPSLPTYTLKGVAVQGDVYMEYHVNEEALQQVILDLFYAPVDW